MIIIHGKPYFSSSIMNTALEGITENVIGGIKAELNKINTAFYSYPASEHSISGAEEIFRIIESTWVGILNNTVLQMQENSVSLLEFGVWNNDKNIGRCDLLFRIVKEEKQYDFITEAKLSEFKGWKRHKPADSYMAPQKQAKNYYTAEKSYYDSQPSEVFVFVFIVEWVRNKTRLDQAISDFNVWSKAPDTETDFLALYHNEQAGAFVYGKFVDVKASGISGLK